MSTVSSYRLVQANPAEDARELEDEPSSSTALGVLCVTPSSQHVKDAPDVPSVLLSYFSLLCY